MDILHLPVNVAGAASGLVEGEKSLGHVSSTLSIEPSRRGFQSDKQVDLFSKGPVHRLINSIKLVAEIRNEYDILNFHFGSSLMHFPRLGLDHVDLPFYGKRPRKIFTYQGCDARQKYPTMARNRSQGNAFAACFNEECYGGACNSGVRDTRRARAIDKAARYADHMFALNPDLMYFLPKEKSSFLPYAIHGYSTIEVPSAAQKSTSETFHIVHAPTDRAVKGTAYVFRTVESLKQTYGDRIRFTLVENMKVDEARRVCAEADVIIDQLLVGWYGGLAVEAMKMGIPVICFINPSFEQFLPDGMMAQMPIINSTPVTLETTLKGLIDNRDSLAEISKASLDYAERWHNPEFVAKLVLDRTFGRTAS